ncbi:MAG TPA: hypothetical protein VE862_12545 [Candidatus Acidoferrum sp.]|nr:hypothetical protein [Candidatus Acidoferrum sp.]
MPNRIGNLQNRTHRRRNPLTNKHEILRIVSLTVFLFSLLVWLYVVLLQVTHPDWLPASFSSHIDFPPFNWRLDDVGMLAFALAVIGFVAWQVEVRIANTT